MASTVQVLCPNGRRQNVKTTPNTKILQVLEEVCSKQGFPSNDCNLVYGNKELDVTLTIRYSGLPNHAKLELKKANIQRSESDVTVALALESGVRLTHLFSPSTPLWDILQYWEQQEEYAQKGQILPVVEGQHPVCIYMREEFIGEDCIKETTLYKLGLTQGKIMLRLTHRAVDHKTLKEIRETIEKDKARKGKIKATATSTNTTISKEKELPTQSTISDVNKFEHGKREEGSCEISRQPSSKIDTQSTEGGRSDTKEEPMDTASTSENTAKALASSGPIVHVPGAEVEENQCVVTQDERADMDTDERPGIEIAGRMIRTQEEFNQMMAEMMEKEMAAMAAEKAAALKSQKAAQAKGNPSQSQKPPQRESRPVEPCDRETVLYSLDDMQMDQSGMEDPGDDFFQVTERDVKKMMKDLQSKCSELDDQPLMTQGLRQTQFEKKTAKYQQAVIRIQFPDRKVLQGLFKPLETVDTLYKFVKSHLEDKDLKFYLYTTPPRSVLNKRNISLAEAGLVPLSVVHFGRESASSAECHVSSAVMAEISTPTNANTVVMKSLSLIKEKKQTGTGTYEPVAGTSGMASSAACSRSGATGGPSTSASSTQKPKWFMVGKK